MFKENLFNACLAKESMTKEELAKKLGIHPTTLSRKISNDGAFDREEINKIIDILHIDNPEEIFFAKEIE
jgi:DNA-binding XRE family transcriptional regulator